MTKPVKFTHAALANHASETLDADLLDTVETQGSENRLVKQSESEPFLQHYEQFVGTPIEDPLAWQSQTFHAMEGKPGFWSYPIVKAGAIGLGGLASLSLAGGLVAKDWVQPTSPTGNAASQSKFKFKPASPQVAPVSSIAAPAATAEFSQPMVASAPVPKVEVARTVSPAVRSPLPNQVMSQPTVSAIAATSATIPKAVKAAPASKSLAKQPEAKPTSEAAAPVQTPPAVVPVPSAAIPSASLPLVNEQPAAAPSAGVPNPTASPGSTPMPPGDSVQPTVAPNEAAPSPSSTDEVTSALKRRMLQSTTTTLEQKQEPSSVLPPMTENSPPVKMAMVPSKPQADKAGKQQVIVGSLPQEVQPKIQSAETIQDFLKISKTLPNNLQTAVVSLTPQAATAVPNTNELEQFQVFRMPKENYQKAWTMLTNTSENTASAPQYGFIDYQQNAIVLPMP